MLFPKLEGLAPTVGHSDIIAQYERAMFQEDLLRTARDAYKLPETDDPIICAALKGQKVLQWFQDPTYAYGETAYVPDLVRRKVRDALPEDARDSETVVTVAAAAPFFDGASINRAIRGIMTGFNRGELVRGEGIKPAIYNLAQIMTARA